MASLSLGASDDEIHSSKRLHSEHIPDTEELISIDQNNQDKPTAASVDEANDSTQEGILALVEHEEIVPHKVEMGHFFHMDQLFKTEENGVEWLMDVSRSLKIVLVRGRSDYSEGRNAYIKYVCERGGPSRNYQNAYVKKTSGKGKSMPRMSMSKKFGCEFLLLPRNDKKNDCWKVTVKNGFHNHSIGLSNMGYSFLGRLKPKEQELVSRMTRSGVLPKVIRKELKVVNQDNCTSAQTIYNQSVKLKKQLRHNRTVMQEVLHQACNSDVFLWYTHNNEVVENLFWAGKKSLMLASKFPYVLIMDCTYKTNFYKFPLLQVVGISSTKLTFSIAFTYLGAEKKENHEWALRALREALVDNINLTQVIITDRELALMDAIQTIFPSTTHLLCRWHIEKAIKAHIRRGISDLECDEIISAWKKIVYNESDEQLKFALEECKGMVSKGIFNYVESTWVKPYKERFISMWTNRVFHLGNTQTSRIEGAHAALKN